MPRILGRRHLQEGSGIQWIQLSSAIGEEELGSRALDLFFRKYARLDLLDCLCFNMWRLRVAQGAQAEVCLQVLQDLRIRSQLSELVHVHLYHWATLQLLAVPFDIETESEVLSFSCLHQVVALVSLKCLII